MRMIWATRGRDWGFRFLRDGGFVDPLIEYQKTFSEVDESSEICCFVKDRVALRFPDPLGRRDRSGRVIVQEFVLLDPETGLDSVGDARELVWPEVRDEFAAIWMLPEPPVATG